MPKEVHVPEKNAPAIHIQKQADFSLPLFGRADLRRQTGFVLRRRLSTAQGSAESALHSHLLEEPAGTVHFASYGIASI